LSVDEYCGGVHEKKEKWVKANEHENVGVGHQGCGHFTMDITNGTSPLNSTCSNDKITILSMLGQILHWSEWNRT
jgi:hypothetical protein